MDENRIHDPRKVTQAFPDPNLLDFRVLRNLLCLEKTQLARRVPFCQWPQQEVTMKMMQVLSQWLLEVCEHQQCEEGVYQLCLCLLCTYMSMSPVKIRQLQRLGSVCLFLASKMRDLVPITVEKLCMYTDYSVTAQKIMTWELLVLSKLHWNLVAVVPDDFLEHILVYLQLWQWLKLIRRHAQTYIVLCTVDYSFYTYGPSVVAASSVVAAVFGLGLLPRSGTGVDLILNVAALIEADSDNLRKCQEMMEIAFANTLHGTRPL
ncbi:G1/S-specific cyclin-D3 [Pelobates fuscus]|uniref:G1/S-specific cyclin-D3 n=1 Tax=Pelobates fuscus TaxID=191477 RepID=UPI002FE47369